MDGIELIGIIGAFAGIFSTGFSAIYLKMLKMAGDISKLNTKVDLVYDNLNIALEFKRQNDRIKNKK